jgi:hypothetical protein
LDGVAQSDIRSSPALCAAVLWFAMLRIVGNACRLGTPQKVTDAEGRIDGLYRPIRSTSKERLVQVQGIYIMENNTFRFDESKYPHAWVFNDDDCVLSDDEKRKIIFLETNQSQRLWDIFFPFEHLMLPTFNINCFSILDEVRLEFNGGDGTIGNGTSFFSEKLKDVDIVFCFWGRHYVAIMPKFIFIKVWEDFFYYTMDDGNILFVPNHDLAIFCESPTFFGKLIRQRCPVQPYNERNE